MSENKSLFVWNNRSYSATELLDLQEVPGVHRYGPKCFEILLKSGFGMDVTNKRLNGYSKDVGFTA